jgi:hypothetical protein
MKDKTKNALRMLSRALEGEFGKGDSDEFVDYINDIIEGDKE